MATGTMHAMVLSKAPFIKALVAHGCSEATAAQVADTVVQMAGLKRPAGFPVTTAIALGTAGYEVTADVRNDNVLVLVSITPISTGTA